MLQHRDQHGGDAEHRVAAIGREHFQHQAGIERLDQHLRCRLETAPITQQTQPPV